MDRSSRSPGTRRRRVGALLVALAATVSVSAACGTAGPGTGNKIQIWTLEDPVYNSVLEQSIQQYNQRSDVDATMSTYINDPYKQKLQVSMGSPQAPDIFYNWGGGNIAQYVKAGEVVDLTGYLNKHPEFKNAFLPAAMELGKIDGRYYALPMLGTQPVMLFYNKAVFESAGVSPPKTYADLLSLIDTFKTKGITPIVLPGSQGWTELMWLEYLTARIGGPEVFDAIQAGKKGAWKDPAIIKALEKCQRLVKRGAFGSDYASITYDNGSASTLLAQGKAAMFLMGSWEVATQQDNNPKFLASGDLGWTTFPTVKGSSGDPKALVGNPSNYFSIASSSNHVTAAKEFLRKTLVSEHYLQGVIKAGQVPAVKNIEDDLRKQPNSEFTTFTYDLVQHASTFTQSWDQALNPSVASKMLTSLQRVFLLEISPQQFATTMEQAQ